MLNVNSFSCQILILIYLIGFVVANVNPTIPTIIFVDSFTEYLSGHCKKYCDEQGIRIVECVSPYMQKVLSNQGYDIPDGLKSPEEGEETNWSISLELFKDDHHGHEYIEEKDHTNKFINVICLSESDAGVSTAERIQSELNLRGNGKSPHLRNKYLLNERIKEKGFPVVKQKLVHSWQESESFLINTLNWKPVNKPTLDDHIVDSTINSEPVACVLKPCIGVASEGVYKCNNFEEVKAAFQNLYMKPKYGGGINEAVVIQECLLGTEYAVDTVSRDGEIKVVALWKYKKYSLNNAPFVYQCSELISSRGTLEKQVCDYCVNILSAAGVNWGPTHTEIMLTKDGPRLVEVNGRWHAQHFKPITDRCLGYDALISTIDAFFFPDKFDAVPSRPNRMQAEGVIIHLISVKEGKILNINHIDIIKQLPSVIYIHMEFNIGDTLIKTVDIRTDCGYILLSHPNREVMERDYATIVKLQSTLFDIEIENNDNINIKSKKKNILLKENDNIDYDTFFEQAAQDFVIPKDNEYDAVNSRHINNHKFEKYEQYVNNANNSENSEKNINENNQNSANNENYSARNNNNNDSDSDNKDDNNDDDDDDNDTKDDTDLSEFSEGLHKVLDEEMAPSNNIIVNQEIDPNIDSESTSSITITTTIATNTATTSDYNMREEQSFTKTETITNDERKPISTIMKSTQIYTPKTSSGVTISTEKNILQTQKLFLKTVGQLYIILKSYQKSLLKLIESNKVIRYVLIQVNQINSYIRHFFVAINQKLSTLSESPVGKIFYKFTKLINSLFSKIIISITNIILNKLANIRLNSPFIKLILGTLTVMVVNYIALLVSVVYVLPNFEEYIL